MSIERVNRDFCRVATNMFDGVESDTLECQLCPKPLSPVLNVLLDFWMRIVEVSKHEIVIISFLFVYIV